MYFHDVGRGINGCMVVHPSESCANPIVLTEVSRVSGRVLSYESKETISSRPPNNDMKLGC